MLKFEFSKQFHTKNNTIFKKINKVLKWFGG
jgi:hypothetical protein